MAKWVTIKRKEFNRLTKAEQYAKSPDIQVPDGYIVLAKGYYDELYGYQCELTKLKQQAEDRKYDALLGEAEIALLKADAEKWRAISSKDNVAEYVAAAELGALVRKMPVGYDLRHYGERGWYVEDRSCQTDRRNRYTPEEALTAFYEALKETE